MSVDDSSTGAEPPAEMKVAEHPLEWESGLLVYAGDLPSNLDIVRLIGVDRERRMLDVYFGSAT